MEDEETDNDVIGLDHYVQSYSKMKERVGQRQATNDDRGLVNLPGMQRTNK